MQHLGYILAGCVLVCCSWLAAHARSSGSKPRPYSSEAQDSYLETSAERSHMNGKTHHSASAKGRRLPMLQQAGFNSWGHDDIEAMKIDIPMARLSHTRHQGPLLSFLETPQTPLLSLMSLGLDNWGSKSYRPFPIMSHFPEQSPARTDAIPQDAHASESTLFRPYWFHVYLFLEQHLTMMGWGMVVFMLMSFTLIGHSFCFKCQPLDNDMLRILRKEDDQRNTRGEPSDDYFRVPRLYVLSDGTRGTGANAEHFDIASNADVSDTTDGPCMIENASGTNEANGPGVLKKVETVEYFDMSDASADAFDDDCEDVWGTPVSTRFSECSQDDATKSDFESSSVWESVSTCNSAGNCTSVPGLYDEGTLPITFDCHEPCAGQLALPDQAVVLGVITQLENKASDSIDSVLEAPAPVGDYCSLHQDIPLGTAQKEKSADPAVKRSSPLPETVTPSKCHRRSPTHQVLQENRTKRQGDKLATEDHIATMDSVWVGLATVDLFMETLGSPGQVGEQTEVYRSSQAMVTTPRSASDIKPVRSFVQ